MEQGRFWARRRSFKRSPRRVRKIELSVRGIYEPVENEEDVLSAVKEYLWRCGIPVDRVRERVPYCWNCKAKVCKESEAGHPDLHGYVPVRAAIRWAKDEGVRDWRKAHLKYAIPFYIEMKRPKGSRKRLSQEMYIHRVTDDGVLGFFCRGVEEARAAFATIDIVLPIPQTYTMEKLECI